MNKREFMKSSMAVVAGAMVSRLGGDDLLAAQAPRTNWAGNYTFKAAHLDEPATATEVQKLVTGLQHAKALGARHSFNDIADSVGDQISLVHLNEMTLDKAARTVTVGAGVRYGTLAPWLDGQGFAVHNLASLPHVSVVGATQTGTHGSGVRNGSLSTVVSGMEFVDGTGQLRTLTRQSKEFAGAVVAMGALGVITRITLDVVPTFQIAQIVYENLSFDQLKHNLETIFSSGYSVSLFTDWQKHRATQVWLKQTVGIGPEQPLPAEFYGATLQKEKLHPLAGHPAENCTEQMGVPGPWYERLPHFKMNFTPSSGAELQTEYFVPRAQAYQAILAVEKLRDQITPHLFVTELRTIAMDELWMSMAYQRESLAIHFTWKPEMAAVLNVLPHIEASLAPFGARPHWAKVFTTPKKRLEELYPRMEEFRELAKQYDPGGKFRNQYLEKVLA